MQRNYDIQNVTKIASALLFSNLLQLPHINSMFTQNFV